MHFITGNAKEADDIGSAKDAGLGLQHAPEDIKSAGPTGNTEGLKGETMSNADEGEGARITKINITADEVSTSATTSKSTVTTPGSKKLNESAPPFIPMSHMMPKLQAKESSAPTVPNLEIEVMQLWQRLQAKTLEAQGLDKQIKDKFMSLEQARRQIHNLEQQLRSLGGIGRDALKETPTPSNLFSPTSVSMDAALGVSAVDYGDSLSDPPLNPPNQTVIDTAMDQRRREGDRFERDGIAKLSLQESPTAHAFQPLTPSPTSSLYEKSGISPGAQDIGPLPSKGSVGHMAGTCKRCCFFPRGRCMGGQDCNFCHFDHEKRKRKSKSKRSSLGSSTFNSNDSNGDDVQWDEVAKDILGMLRGPESEKGAELMVPTTTTVNANVPVAVMRDVGRLEIKIGGEYEGKAADGSWWPCRITTDNLDGTYEASVHDAYNSKWSNVHRMNLRLVQHTPMQSWHYGH